MVAYTAHMPRTTSPPAAPLSFAEHTCLAVVAEGDTHGWAIGAELAPDGPIGRVWTLSRPLTYRAIDTIVAAGLVRRAGSEPGHGRRRTKLSISPPGRKVSRAWLDEPVAHPRDVRTELLVKLLLRERAGLDAESLLQTQQQAFSSMLDTLTSAEGDLVDLWRREQARAIRRFLHDALDRHRESSARPVGTTSSGDGQRSRGPRPRPPLRLSARNQLSAVVGAINHGDVMSTVHVTLPDGQRLTAAITKDAAIDLDIAPGDDVIVIVKSTEVMLAPVR